MSTEPIVFTAGEAGLRSLLQRAVGLDSQALVRFQTGEHGVEAFVSTPFGVLAARRIQASLAHDGMVLSAQAVVEHTNLRTLDAAWQFGALPPISGFQLLDEIPANVVYTLHTQGRDLAKQFSGPLGPPASLLDQTVLSVTGGQTSVEIPMRMIFAMHALGLIPTVDAPLEIPRYLRVSAAGRWVRIDAPFGSVYYAQALNLLTF